VNEKFPAGRVLAATVEIIADGRTRTVMAANSTLPGGLCGATQDLLAAADKIGEVRLCFFLRERGPHLSPSTDFCDLIKPPGCRFSADSL
jgi:hypothetical protein